MPNITCDERPPANITQGKRMIHVFHVDTRTDSVFARNRISAAGQMSGGGDS
jgi:hypothetical protein